jgi:hypothetical protein
VVVDDYQDQLATQDAIDKYGHDEEAVVIMPPKHINDE